MNNLFLPSPCGEGSGERFNNKQMKQFKLTILTALFFSGVALLQAQGLQTVQAVPANDFLKSIGVNTSIDSRNEYFSNTKSCAAYLGFRYIRGASTGSKLIQSYQLFNQYHIRFSLMLGASEGIADALEAGNEIVTKIDPDALIAFEGPNEPNNWPITYNGIQGGGSSSYKQLAIYQRDFYAAVKADSVLKNYPVWSMTDGAGAQTGNFGLQFLTVPAGVGRGPNGVDASVADGTAYDDVACVHNYFSVGWLIGTNNWTWVGADPINGNNTLKTNFGVTWNKSFQGYSDAELLTLPRVTTETGTTIDGINVTEEIQGLTYLSCYLSQFKQGFQYTAIYILRDRTDESGNQTFGFYDGNYNPRLSAHYLHNMTTILADYPSIETPGQLTYGISAAANNPNPNISTVHDLLLQKNDGTMMLVIWDERYAHGAKSDTVQVDFGETLNTVDVYSPAQYDAANPEDGNKKPIATCTNTNQVKLTMLNRPLILAINDPNSPTGVEKVEAVGTAVNIFPNPAVDNLYVGNPSCIKNYTVFDLSGRSVLSGAIPAAGRIDIASLSHGVYIIRFTKTDGNTESLKFVKL